MGRSAPRRGFNLVEIAIVLAVVGLLMGAIYGAASLILDKRRVKTTVEQFNQIAANTRATFAFADSFVLPTNAQIVAYKIMPPSVIVDAGGNFVNAYGGNIRLYTPVSVTTNLGIGVGSGYFGLGFKGLPTGACMALLTQFGTPQLVAKMGIYDIGNGPDGMGPANVSDGITPAEAQNMCRFSGNTNQIDFELSMREN